MKRMTATVLVGLVAWVGAVALAQDVEPAPRTELVEALEAARERLALTDEQAEQMRPILEADLAARLAVLEEHGIELDAAERPRLNLRELRELSAALAAVRADTLKALANALTAEQLATYQELQAEAAEALRDRLRNRQRSEA